MLRTTVCSLCSVSRRSVIVARRAPLFSRAAARKMSTNPLHVPQGEVRDEPASNAQLDLANKLASSGAVDADGIDPAVTKGEASDFIQEAEVQLAEAGNPVNPVKIPQGETRDEPATNKQLEFAEQLASSEAVDESDLSDDMTKGEASDFIQDATQKTAEQTLDSIRDATDSVAPSNHTPFASQWEYAKILADELRNHAARLREGMTWLELQEWIYRARAISPPPVIGVPESDYKQPAKGYPELVTRAQNLAKSNPVAALESPLDTMPEPTVGDVVEFIMAGTRLWNRANIRVVVPVDGPPTAKQLALAKRMGLEVDEGITKYGLWDKIMEEINERQRKRRENGKGNWRPRPTRPRSKSAEPGDL